MTFGPERALGIVYAVGVLAMWPYFKNGAEALRWPWLGMGLAVVLALYPPQRVTSWLGVALLGWCLVHVSGHPDSIRAGLQLGVLALAFCSGCYLRGEAWLWVGGALALGCTSSVLLQYWDLWPWNQTASPGGLFYNKNMQAEVAVLGVVALIALRKWLLALAIAPVVVLTVSKGALIGLGGALGYWGYAHYRKATLSLGACVLPVIAYFVWTSWTTSVLPRVGPWWDTVQVLQAWGHGLGMYYRDAPVFLASVNGLTTRYEHPHNELLEWGYEIGLVGVGLATLLIVRNWHRTGDLPARCVLIAGGLVALVSFPLHQPVTGSLLVGCLGLLCAERSRAGSQVGNGRVAVYERTGRGGDRGADGVADKGLAVGSRAKPWSGRDLFPRPLQPVVRRDGNE